MASPWLRCKTDAAPCTTGLQHIAAHRRRRSKNGWLAAAFVLPVAAHRGSTVGAVAKQCAGCSFLFCRFQLLAQPIAARELAGSSGRWVDCIGGPKGQRRCGLAASLVGPTLPWVLMEEGRPEVEEEIGDEEIHRVKPDVDERG